MIHLRRGTDTVSFEDNDRGRTWAAGFISMGWEQYDPETGEPIPAPVIPLQWAWGAWRPGLPKTPPSKGE